MIMAGFGAALLTDGSAANAVPDTTKDGGHGDTISGERWAHSLGGHSADDHFAFLSTDHGTDRWHPSSDFKPRSEERFDLTSLGLSDFLILALASTSTSVPAHTIAWIYDGKADETTVYVNSTDHSLSTGDTALVEVHLQGMVTVEPSELAFALDQAAPTVAANPIEPGSAAAHGGAPAVAIVTADVSSDATPEAHDKHTNLASDQHHTHDTDQDRMEASDHAGPIPDDETGKHLTGITSNDAAMVSASTQPSVNAQQAPRTDTVTTANPVTNLDKDDAPANDSGTAPTPSYLIHTANTTAPDVPEVNTQETPDMNTDSHSNKHGLVLGPGWTQSSRGDWQFNFSWKSDDSPHTADLGTSVTHMNASMHGGDAFHFDPSSMMHEAAAAGDASGHHSSEENSDAARSHADHFHAALHAGHGFMV